MIRTPHLKKLWRSWLRHESPHRPLNHWSAANKVLIAIFCLFIAIISSWQFLAEPDIRTGIPSPFEAKAPDNAIIVDSEKLQRKRTELLSGTFVQVIDKSKSRDLIKGLKNKLNELASYTQSNSQENIISINIEPQEKDWLISANKVEMANWESEIIFTAEKMLSQGIVNNLALDQLNDAISIQLKQLGNKKNPQRTIGIKLLNSTFYRNGNITIDPLRSKSLIEKIINQQGIPTIKIRKGDLITRKGEKINQRSLDILDHFGMVNKARPIIWLLRFSEAFASCAILIIVMRRERPSLQARQAFLTLSLLLIILSSVNLLEFEISPLALIVPPTLLISQGLGSTSAIIWVSIVSLLWPIPINIVGESRMLTAIAVALIVGIQGARMRSRAQLLQMAFLLPFGALIGEWLLLRSPINSSNSSWGRFLPNSEELFSEGLIIGAMLMISILLIPLIENTFGLITKARLMELSDQERPLLRRLSSEAPGTFEHTLLLCGLAEEGARQIGADTDLIRAGALYHDIGKIHAPKWFIENQSEGNNPHEQLNDPFASAIILQAHVDEGLKLAKRYRLPSPIADFIPEHQGTLKMGYFLHQARSLDPKVPEENFRYNGPIPQSKETAILMLADGCEAALRSLDLKITDNEAYITIRKIIDARKFDGQLKQSNLSKAELEIVSRAFINVWKRMRHRRIPYPISNTKNAFPA